MFNEEMFNKFSVIWKLLDGPSKTCRINFDILQNFYSSPGRYYHTFQHIKQCLDEFVWGDHPHMTYALWYHDAIYCTDGTRDNELESSFMAVQASMGFYSNILSNGLVKVQKMILSTSHKEIGETEEERLIADIDLSILGKGIKTYNKYSFNIRREYHQYSDKEYSEGRKKVLQGFLDRSKIYNTDHFYEKYEKQARENIARELDEV